MWETRRSPRQTTCGLGHSRAPTPAGPGSPCRPRPDSPPWRPLLIHRRSRNVLGQKVSDRRRDLACVGLECEVAGVEQPHLSVAVVALERLGTRREEERIVLAPHREQRRSVRTVVFVELRVPRDIAALIEEQVELDLVIARTNE